MLEKQKTELKMLLQDIRCQLVDWVYNDGSTDSEKLFAMQQRALDLGYRVAINQIFEKESFD